VWDFYLQREAWYVRDPLLLALLVVGAIFVLGTVAAVYTMPDEHIQALIRKPLAGQYTYKTDYTGRFLFQYFSRAAFVLFILRFVRTPRQLLWVFVTMLACIFFAVPFAVHSYLTATGTDVRALTRVVNWADNANRFAFGLLLGVAFLYYLTMRSRGVWIRVVALLGTVILIPVVLMSASRSGFMGMLLLAGLVLFGAFGGARQGSRRGALAVMALIAGVGVATYFTVLPARMQQRILNLNPFAEQPAEGSKSTSFRTATIEHSVEIIAEHPMLGVGLGNFRWVHKLRYGLFKPPHNSYLWALAEGGVPLLLAYLVIFAMLWRRLGKLRASYAEHPVVPRFPEWLRVYIVLLLFFSFFADVWIEEHVFLLIGATMLLDHWRRAYSEPAAAPAVLTAVAA
jgi:O-antigen ligase